jgi:hypothetical protein
MVTTRQENGNFSFEIGELGLVAMLWFGWCLVSFL